MADRERLIELFLQPMNVADFYDKEMIAKAYADRIISDGWIRQPCKVGDKMYCDGKHFASHCEGEVMEFLVNSVKTSVRNIFRGEIDVQFDFDDFGKTVFLTREEAEKALKERKNNV